MARIIKFGENFLQAHPIQEWQFYISSSFQIVDGQDVHDLRGFFADVPDARRMLEDYLNMAPALRSPNIRQVVLPAEKKAAFEGMSHTPLKPISGKEFRALNVGDGVIYRLYSGEAGRSIVIRKEGKGVVLANESYYPMNHILQIFPKEG